MKVPPYFYLVSKSGIFTGCMGAFFFLCLGSKFFMTMVNQNPEQIARDEIDKQLLASDNVIHNKT